MESAKQPKPETAEAGNSRNASKSELHAKELS